MVSVLSTLFQVLLLFLSFIMIVLVLLQRGRGGGLAGAFGGMGGQSAFGTKAGDVFTRITVVVAILWVLSAGLMGLTARASQNSGSKNYLDPADKAAASGGASESTGTVKGDNAAPESPAGKPATGEAGSGTSAGAAPPPPSAPPTTTTTAPPAEAPKTTETTPPAAEAPKPTPPATEEKPAEPPKNP